MGYRRHGIDLSGRAGSPTRGISRIREIWQMREIYQICRICRMGETNSRKKAFGGVRLGLKEGRQRD